MHKSLLIYRTTPLESGFFPAKLLYGRSLRTGLLSIREKESTESPARDKSLKERQKRNFDKPGKIKRLGLLDKDTRVWIKTSPTDGAEGTVVEAVEEPDFYIVERRGQLIRTNRAHLAELPSETEQTDSVCDSDEFLEGNDVMNKW